MNPMAKTPAPSDLELLKQHAEELWEHQQEVFAAAANAARAVGRQGASFTREEVTPRVRQVVSIGGDAVRTAASMTRPAITDALATVTALSDPQVRSAIFGLARGRGAAPAAVVAVTAKKGIGIGGWIGIGIGVLAAGAIAYAVWQTLRADDDLWVEDEEADETEAEESPAEA